MFARAVSVKGVVALFAPVGICTVKLAVKAHNGDLMGVERLEGVEVREEMVKGQKNV